MRLTAAGAQLYLSTSQVALDYGVLSWDEYLLRLRFVRDSSEPGTLEVRSATDILQEHGVEGEDEWPIGEPEETPASEGSSESVVDISERDSTLEPPILF